MLQVRLVAAVVSGALLTTKPLTNSEVICVFCVITKSSAENCAWLPAVAGSV
jgi:hypothetical protein